MLLAYGCSDDNTSEPDNGEQVDPSLQETQHESETKLEVVKEYEEEIGHLEAYYMKKDNEYTTSEEGIDLKITSLEYGKVLINEVTRSTYANMADAEGKNTYVKLGVEISGDYEKFNDLTFYAYQASLKLNNSKTIQADSTYSDKVMINGENTAQPIRGYLYFIVDVTMPFEQATLIAPAPFKNENSESISSNYEIGIEFLY